MNPVWYVAAMLALAAAPVVADEDEEKPNPFPFKVKAAIPGDGPCPAQTVGNCVGYLNDLAPKAHVTGSEWFVADKWYGAYGVFDWRGSVTRDSKQYFEYVISAGASATADWCENIIIPCDELPDPAECPPMPDEL